MFFQVLNKKSQFLVLCFWVYGLAKLYEGGGGETRNFSAVAL